MKTLIALYDSWETADAVIEALLDYGFSHADITVMSGDHWTRESGAEYTLEAGASTDHGAQALLKLRASSSMAEVARILVCNSGAYDVRELAGEEEEEVEAEEAPVAIALHHPVMK
jgi:hypothetical protein